MQCPKCKNGVLASKKLSSKELEVDQCSECKGIWFDKGELSVILGGSASTVITIPETSAISPFVECPRCELSLYEFCYPGSLTPVDACEECHGVWLDNKEWQVISQSRKQSNYSDAPIAEIPVKTSAITIEEHSEELASTSIKYKSKKHKSAKSNEDEIPGVKGTLLRYIEDTIYRLS